MFKRFLLGYITFFCLAINLANATAINKQADDIELNIQELTMPVIDSPIQTDSFQMTVPENTLWIKKVLGEHFYHYFTQKIINKKIKASSLKMDFRLGSLFQATTKADQANNTYVEINKTRIKTLDVADIQFSDESYAWNPANISMVKLGSDYQQFVNDEDSAENTYKEFLSGEESNSFKGFIDEHFDYRESGLLPYLILLFGILILVTGFMLKPKVIQYLYPD